MSLDLRFETIVEALYFEAKEAVEARGVTFIDDEGGEEVVSWLVALEESRGRAGAMQRAGIEAREPVLLLVPTSSEFLFLFFGLMLAGAIPCPLSPPASFGDIADFEARVRKIAKYLGARRVVTTAGLQEMLSGGPSGAPAGGAPAGGAPAGGAPAGGLEVLLAEDLRISAAAHGPDFQAVRSHAHDTAFIQCTSGSTGLSKGVMLSHENLISNCHQIGWQLHHRPHDVYVCWLPLYHDMGLIGCLINSIYWNLEAVFLSPYRFLRRPATWLQAIARHRGTISPAPNFAYGYTAARAKDAELEGCDLSSWRITACGAEPIDPRTLLAFRARFAKFGLGENVLVTCYGLAEATVGVSFHEPGTPLEWDRVDRVALAERGEVIDVGPDVADALEVVACGVPIRETRVRILDEDGRELPERRVGRVLVKGPSVMSGYFALPEETAAVLKDGWLETGDQGYLRDGKIHITGRKKDLVIIRGKKYVPSDFEWAAGDVGGVRPGSAVAFGVQDRAAGTEALVMVVETDVSEPAEREKIVAAVKKRVQERTGITPASVHLWPRNTVPKTSSGKLQRAKTKEMVTSGETPT